MILNEFLFKLYIKKKIYKILFESIELQEKVELDH